METQTFKHSSLCGQIHLTKCFRGPIAEFMNGVDREIVSQLGPLSGYGVFK